MASSASEHTADEAGGEAIFSSDGLPSLALPPPPGAAAAAHEEETGDAIISESINTVSVFENFIVKSDVEKGWGVLSKTNEQQQTEQIIDVDDPRRRLFRLKAEIEELETEMEKQAADRQEAVDTELRHLSSELKGRLETMGINDDASIAIMLRGRQEDLSRVISRDMEKFASKEKVNETITEEGEKGKIVYELYQSGTATSSKETLLEERLRHLEISVGSGEGGASLFERVEEAMKLAKEVDAKEIDKVAAKAKVIRLDLEAAARAKSKLSSNNNASLAKEDAQTITSLHNQLVELEGISAYLPALTSRLTELSNLHSNAAEFGSRMDAAEETLTRSEALLASVEEALGKMEGGWKENMEAVERSVKKLDELVAGK
eukprot:scaffold10890_cov62-Cyclotella_meneghiniana.AAC.4